MNGAATLRFGDVEVRRIGLGTNRLRNTPANLTFLGEAVAAGLGHIDTAHTYTGGESERTIGAALAPIPEQCIVATKGGWASGRPDALRTEIDESLARLRTDSIPLYYLHRPDPETRLEDSLATIKEYHDSGKIRRVGISNVGIDEIERAGDGGRRSRPPGPPRRSWPPHFTNTADPRVQDHDARELRRGARSRHVRQSVCVCHWD
jgi:hypothetical protein